MKKKKNLKDNIKAVLKLQFKNGTCKYKHSQSLILRKQDRQTRY